MEKEKEINIRNPFMECVGIHFLFVPNREKVISMFPFEKMNEAIFSHWCTCRVLNKDFDLSKDISVYLLC